MKEEKNRELDQKDLRQATQGIASGIVILAVLATTHWLIVSFFGFYVPFWLIGVLYASVLLSLVMDIAVAVRTNNKLRSNLTGKQS